MMTGFNSKKAMANDRMAELIKEATALAWVDRIANGPVPMYAEEHMIKLAELIIQECLNICEELGDKGMDGHYCADKISKTFRS
jgi:hypothetical protein